MLKNASNASAQCTQCVNDAAAARVESAREDTKTCVACELVLRKECFSDRMWASVAALHRKCKRCIAESTTDMKTCVVCEKAQQKDCFSEKMWDGRAEQHRKCKRCIDDAKLQRGKWKCVECKGAFGREEYSSWLAGRTTQKADGKQRCNECCAGQERKRKEVAERSHASVTKVRKTG